MKKLSILLLAAALASFLASCANPINAYTAQQYYDYGVQAERGGDLTLAQRNFSRAYGGSRKGSGFVVCGMSGIRTQNHESFD